jgi:hypothetical protein
MRKQLEPARLIKLKKIKGTGKNGEPRAEPDGAPIKVQFNPTSLRISYTNNVDRGGVTTDDQRRQNPSARSATLNFDLEFDTAEERDAQRVPLDVRTRTANIRQFAEPSASRPKQPPPLLQFRWGSFSFVGIVTQLVEDIDFFSPEGRPLRAKVSVTMREVRLDIEAKKVGRGNRTGDKAAQQGQRNATNAGPGSAPASNPDRATVAQLGESVQQLLARVDEDPATWRAAMTGLDSPLSLPAGTQVQLTAGASAGPALGATTGFAEGSAVRSPASLATALGEAGEGPDATAGIRGPAGPGVGAAGDIAAGGGFTSVPDATAAGGFALAEGGGVAASARTVAERRVQASVTAARAAFEVPAVRTPARAPSQLAPPVDPRTLTYGRDIPLRARPERHCSENRLDL